MNAKKISFWNKDIVFNRRKLAILIVIGFLLAGVASGVFINHIFPLLTSVPGFHFFAPRFTVVVNRTEQIRVHEGVEVRQLYERVRASTVTIKSYEGSLNPSQPGFVAPNVGSGLIVTSDGLIFTTKSIVLDTSRIIQVQRHDGTNMTATILAFDPKSELAIIKVNTRDWPVIDFGNSIDRLVGEKLVGSGPSLSAFSQSLFSGELSGKTNSTQEFPVHRDIDQISEFIQIVPPPPANLTGAPFIDSNQQVIGMLTDSGILPGEYLRSALEVFLNSQTLARPQFGFTYELYPPAVSEAAGFPTQFGARVVLVRQNFVGLAINDFIVSVNDTELNDSQSLERLLMNIRVGDTVTIGVYRNGTITQIEMVPGVLQ